MKASDGKDYKFLVTRGDYSSLMKLVVDNLALAKVLLLCSPVPKAILLVDATLYYKTTVT